jgi:peptidoglycan-associated lipoprotein
MLRQSLVIMLVTAAAAGCASQQTGEQGQASSDAQAASSTQTGTGAQASAAGQAGSIQSGSQSTARTESGAAAAARTAGSPSSARSIYYDFDKSIVKDQFRPVVESHGGYLAGHSGAKVVIEGNCDERGSREYNLALGQRRADSVKAKLKLIGVTEAQIETVSWGKEKPKAQGHDEAAWAENRRSDIVYSRMQ